MLKETRKRTRRLAVSAILAALGVVMLYLGAIVEVLDLSVAGIASLVCVLAVLEMGGVWPWMIYLVTSLVSLLLLPQKSPAVIFIVFLGYYPIVKAYYERLSRVLAWVLKLVHFNVALSVLLLLSALFAPIEGMGPLLYVGTYAVGNATFALYDVALTRMITVYLRKFRDRLGIRGW